jgi:gamma-glutamylcyclotransferase (GGCT)/AIG2-like uncharacterized protein YtfP
MDSFEDKNKKPATSAAKPTTEDQNFSASYNGKKPPIVARKFLKADAPVPPSDGDNSVGFRPHHIFLYGTLMDPVQLRKVLQLESTPTLQPATIVGWKIMLWGQYPALVFKPGNIIHGMAYEVQKESHVEYLKFYETEDYKVKGCSIKLANGMEVPGETFIYNGDKNLLKEGSFDFKDWQLEQLERS